MVKIRLRRDGAKKAPYYTIVVADSRYPADGRFIEKVAEWIKKGAKPTDTAMALIKKAGLEI